MNRIELWLLGRQLKKVGIDINKGTIDMGTVITALLSFLSSPLASTIVTDAEVELKTLVMNFLKAHLKAQTPTT